MISIIIASRNRFSYITDLLCDLDKQELPADEVIVVDQSDKPYQTLPCIHIIDGGKGPCRARNLGLKRCTGDIIVFLDDDIRIDPQFLLNLVSPIIRGDYVSVVGSICDKDKKVLNNQYISWKKEYNNWILAITANPDFPGNIQTLSFPAGCAAIHRSVYEDIGGFDEFFDPDGAGEDREFALRLFHNGYSTLFKGDARVSHLGASSGGRRSSAQRGVSPLEKNSVYIVAKYFGEKVFSNFANEWLHKLLLGSLTPNPLSWLASYRNWRAGRRWVSKIRYIKAGWNQQE